MKIIIFLLLIPILWPVRLFAQAIYIDPTTSAAMAVHSGIIDGQLNTTNNKLTLIQSGQLAVTGQLTVVNSLQKDIYKGLSEVSSIMNNLLAVKDIAGISSDIVTDVNRAMGLAQSNPALLLFARQGASEFKTRATDLAIEVSSFVLTGGKGNLMDSGERAKLLNRIVTQLSIIRGVAYGMYRTMYWAKERGILNSLNPYSGFINIDRQIGDNILQQSKQLKP
jgi:hypothetical protein